MKKFSFISILLLFFCACSQEEVMENTDIKSVNQEQYSGVAHDIFVNILSTKFGGYHKEKPNTRANGLFSITPYVENNDTLFYVVQYDEGWELYSPSYEDEMIIASSPKGKFDIKDPNMPDGLKALLSIQIKNQSQIKTQSSISFSPSWGAVSISTADLEKGRIMVKENGIQKNIKYPEVPPGNWVLIDVEELSRNVYESKRTSETEWGQDMPWNKYAKKVIGTNNTLVPAVAGCVAVATAQYFYHTHYKDGIPKFCPVKADLDSDGVSYVFNGSSATIWDNMAINYASLGFDNSAILIGWTGKRLNSNYGLNSTTATDQDQISLLNSVYNAYFNISDFDYSYVKSSINQNYPVFTTAIDYNKGVAHKFLIDKYTITTSVIKYTYGLVRDPWTGEGESPWPEDDVDENGNIIGYAFTNEVTKTQSSDRIMMNWGNRGEDNDVEYNPLIKSWKTGDTTYQSPTIFRRTDVL